MRCPVSRFAGHRREPDLPGVDGTARVDARTKNLTKRLQPGDIAVIDHLDIDRVSAEALVACRPGRGRQRRAASISGRYPNLGPEILVEAGIPLIDSAGHGRHVRARARAQVVRVDDGSVYVGDDVVAKGRRRPPRRSRRAMADARAGLAVQLEAFAANTMEYLRRERELLLDGVGVPDIRPSSRAGTR